MRIALTLLLLVLSFSPAQGKSPNVLLIVADDLGWADLACYGSQLHETPCLDRLASEGAKFEQAYAASPVCSPTRASILTGKHPARLHMTIWRESAKSRGNRKLLQPVCLDSLPLEHTTLAEILSGRGYTTSHIGKWHLGRAEAYPQAHGFQVNIGGTLWGAPQTFWYPFNGDAYFRDWRYVPDLEPSNPGDYLTDRLTDEAIKAVEQSVASDKPFFVNLWYHSVHTPIEGKPDLVNYYQNKFHSGKHTNPHYAAMVHCLDQNVARMLDSLDRLGVRDETLVIFTSDNGGFVNSCKLHPDIPVTSNWPLRSGKGSCYEGGIRVPLIVSGIASQEPKVLSEPVSSCDLLPTILEILGMEEETPTGIDGISFHPLLTGVAKTLQRERLCFHYPHYYQTTTPVSAIRRGDWKLLSYYEDGRKELYDLSQDASESTNLADQYPELSLELFSELEHWLKTVDAQKPEVNTSK